MSLRKAFAVPAAALLAPIGPSAALAAGQPEPWQMGFQEAATPVMEQITSFHNMLLVIITAIVALVLLLLAYVMLRFNARRNPVPSRTSHNTLIEVIWTVIPIMILVVIAVPSFKLLYFEDRVPEASLTVKAIGHQWYWTYQYPDYGDLEFDAFIVEDEDLKPDQPRLLTTDTRVVVPVGTNVRVQVTADDVLHSWAVPALGIKIDAVPGRLNETWFRIERAGVYYGQCSELCGSGHGFMPITVEAVSQQDFEAWLEEVREASSGAGGDQADRVADAAAKLAR